MARNKEDEVPILEEFDRVIYACTLTTHHEACGRNYINVVKLVDWWKGTMPIGKKISTRANHMLDYAYRQQHDPFNDQAGSEILFREGEPLIIIFTILCEIGGSHLIYHFREILKNDRHLPFNQEIVEEYFQDMVRDGLVDEGHATSLAREFYTRQWKYCAVKITKDHRRFKRDLIVPIHFKEKITDIRGKVTLWRILVLKDFVHETLQRNAKEYEPSDEKDDGLGPRYAFVLKTYKGPHARKHCAGKRNAFRALQNHSGIMRFFSSFSQETLDLIDDRIPGSQDFNTSQRDVGMAYHLLLEWGTRDLIEFFQQEFPPFLPVEIEKFWMSLFELSTTLKGIHHVNIKRDEGAVPYIGGHWGVKPESILEIDGSFKLADPGFAHLVEKRDDKVMAVRAKDIKGFTYTYGAPEIFQQGDRTLNQGIDVWSLGCIFSIAATWIAFGSYQGVQHYSRYRLEAVSRLNSEISFLDTSTAGVTRFYPGNCFHNGVRVLPEISRWHTFLKATLRQTDTITGAVLDLVDKYMLVEDPSNRLTLTQLGDELRRIRIIPAPADTVIAKRIAVSLTPHQKNVPEQATFTTLAIMPQAPTSHIIFEEGQNLKCSLDEVPIWTTAYRFQREIVSSMWSRKVLADFGNASTDAHERERSVSSLSGSTPPSFQQRRSPSFDGSSSNIQYSLGVQMGETAHEPYVLPGRGKLKRRRGFKLRKLFFFKREQI